MRRSGFFLMAIGVVGFFYCSSQLQALPPLPPDLELLDSLRQPTGRFEVGRFASAAAAAIGALLALFPQGR